MGERFYNVKGLSEYMGMKPQTIYNKINRGDFPIPFKKVFGRIRFEREDVNQFINKLPLQNNK